MTAVAETISPLSPPNRLFPAAFSPLLAADGAVGEGEGRAVRVQILQIELAKRFVEIKRSGTGEAAREKAEEDKDQQHRSAGLAYPEQKRRVHQQGYI